MYAINKMLRCLFLVSICTCCREDDSSNAAPCTSLNCLLINETVDFFLRSRKKLSFCNQAIFNDLEKKAFIKIIPWLLTSTYHALLKDDRGCTSRSPLSQNEDILGSVKKLLTVSATAIRTKISIATAPSCKIVCS